MTDRNYKNFDKGKLKRELGIIINENVNVIRENDFSVKTFCLF